MGLFIAQLDGLPAVPSDKPAKFNDAGAATIADCAACAKLALVIAEHDASLKWGRTVGDTRALLREARTVTVFIPTGRGNTDCIMLPVRTLQRALRSRRADDALPSQLNPASGHMSIGTFAAIRKAEAAAS